eukprot:768749-Hanusia_phi.AAC.24
MLGLLAVEGLEHTWELRDSSAHVLGDEEVAQQTDAPQLRLDGARQQDHQESFYMQVLEDEGREVSVQRHVGEGPQRRVNAPVVGSEEQVAESADDRVLAGEEGQESAGDSKVGDQRGGSLLHLVVKPSHKQGADGVKLETVLGAKLVLLVGEGQIPQARQRRLLDVGWRVLSQEIPEGQHHLAVLDDQRQEKLLPLLLYSVACLLQYQQMSFLGCDVFR